MTNTNKFDASSLEITPELGIALAAIQQGRNVNVLGKAGTGKSTLINLLMHDDRYKSDGVTLLMGTTGVSALNIMERVNAHSDEPVSASTIHRAFGFSTKPVVVGNAIIRDELMSVFQPRDYVTRIIIDETSMARVDLFQLIIDTLKAYRAVPTINSETIKHLPQIILLGDLLQIEPVVLDQDKERLDGMFDSYFYFDSWAYQELQFVEVALSKVFRTRDADYVYFLNNLREGNVDHADLVEFNSKYVMKEEDFWDILPDPEHPYVTLCPTNKRAEEINNFWMKAIEEPEYTFYGVEKGEVNDKDKIIPDVLKLKVGCVVMIRVNGPDLSYVNGSMGEVVGFDGFEEDELTARATNEDIYILVKVGETVYRIGANKWQLYDAKGEVVGVYKQFPVQLGYACTVHKSQGLEFDYLYFDTSPWGCKFASGLTYVALSRVTSPNGLGLHRKLTLQDVKVDANALKFAQRVESRTLELCSDPDILEEIDKYFEIKTKPRKRGMRA